MVFEGGLNDEGANMLTVYLSGPCFGDTTPSLSPGSSASQSALDAVLHDDGRLDAHQGPQHRPPFDVDGGPGNEASVHQALVGSSARSQRQIEALIDFGGGDQVGAYPAPVQAQLHVHEDLLELSSETPARQQHAQQQCQSHEDSASIAFEAPTQLECYTPGSGYLGSTPQPPGERSNMRSDAGDYQDSQGLDETQFGDENYGSGPRTFGDPLCEDEIDELDEEYSENDLTWPNTRWRGAESNLQGSSPPQVFSSSPGMPSSQTSLADNDEGEHDAGAKGDTIRPQLLPPFMSKDCLGQMGTTEMNASNFQDDTETYPETSVLTGDAVSPAPLTLEQDAFEAEAPVLRAEVVRDDSQMRETPFQPGADPDLDDDVEEARGSVLPLNSPTHDDTLSHPGAYVVAPTLPDQPIFAQALGSADGDSDYEETRGIVSPHSSPFFAREDAVHLEPSAGLIDENRMLVDPQCGKQQGGESEDEARGVDPPLSSILGDFCGSLAESIEYSLDLDNHLGEEIADLADNSIASDNVKTSPAEEHGTSLLHGELNSLASADNSRVFRTEASSRLPTDQVEGATEHDAQGAQIIDGDSRKNGDMAIGNPPATDGYGHIAKQIAFGFPTTAAAFDKDTALTHEHVEYDDSSIFDGHQEPQGLDAGKASLPDLSYRPEVKALCKPGIQEDAFYYRSLKRQPSCAAAGEERKSPRRPVCPSLPNPKRTTAAGRLLQHKKLSKPFKCPTISNPSSTGSAAACRPGTAQSSLSQVKQENQIESFPQVAIPLCKEDTKIKHRTQRAGAQFKSPLTILTSGQQPLIRPTPTIHALERKAQTLKRAVRVLEDKEEATLQALIAKWLEAGREVAYELWTVAKDACGEGGSSGRATDGDRTRKRKVEESWGWDDGNERKKSNLGNGSSWGWVPVPDGDAEHAEDGEGHDASEQHDEGEGGTHETIGTMLMQLGICPSVLGWDEEEGCFVG